jgi:hypothetical protein
MKRIFGALCIIAMATVFGRCVALTSLLDGMPTMITALSIMTAAVFVRLNRGMPSLDWKSIEPQKRGGLTTAIFEVTKEYAQIAALNATLLVILVSLVMFGKEYVSSAWSILTQSVVSSLIGAGLTASIGRMCYVVWRDVDIVRLQKNLIDDAADAEIRAIDLAEADRRIKSIHSSSIRPVPSTQPMPTSE